jgi:hypothetical protein
MLERDRKRMGFTLGQLAWRLGISPRGYREIVNWTSGRRSTPTTG